MALLNRLAAMALVAMATSLVAAACSPGVTEGPGPEEPMDPGPSDPGPADPLPPDPILGPDPEGEADPMETGPAGAMGRLRVKVMMSGEMAKARIRIISPSKEVVATGPSSQAFEVPAGTYDVEVRLEDALDRPEKTDVGVRIPAGETTVHEVGFIVGQIKLQPVRGRSRVGKEIRWRYAGGGDWFEQSSVAGEEIILSAGRYDAEVMVSRRAILIEDIQVYEGRRTISPEVHMR